MADFPPAALLGKEDSKYRTEKLADPVMRNEIEGGYVSTRPRYTRTPRKTWTTGFTHVTEAEKEALVSFWNARRGGSASFTWDDPITSVEYTVRFVGAPSINYVGKGSLYLWDITNITLEQV